MIYKPPVSTIVLLFIMLGLSLFQVSCRTDRNENIPDVSTVSIDYEWVRWDSLVTFLDTTHVDSEVAALRQNHEAFLNIYCQILTDPSYQLEDSGSLFKYILRGDQWRQLYDTTQMIQGDLSIFRKEVDQMLRYHKFYFPQQKTPDVYTYISEYSLGVFTYGEDILAIGLDFFLGKDYPRYDQMVFPEYIRLTMTPQHMLPQLTEALVSGMMPPQQGDRLLDYMIQNGKILYIQDRLLPRVADSLKMGYTSAQMEWCQDNEGEMWKFLLSPIDESHQEALLYSTDMHDFRKLISPSPNSNGMPPEAPGRTANFMGMKIIEAYMARHPEKSFTELINTLDAQFIFEQSKYKPPRR